MDWNDVRYFLALARTGSVRAAGTSLSVSHSTVARRVETLEEELATRLFDRSRDGFALTDAGEQMLVRAECVEKEMAGLERDLAGQDERFEGRVAVTCCDEFVSAILIEHLTPFCAEYPDIELALTNDSRAFDLAKREADIAVRIKARDAQPPGYLLGQKTVPIVVANYVAIEHEARLDPEVQGSEPRWVAFDDERQTDVMISTSSYPHVPRWGSMSSLALMLQAVRAGLGICMLPCYVGDGDPSLRRLAKPDLRYVADMWLLSHPDLRNNARLTAARTCIAAALRDKVAYFRGDEPCHGDATQRLDFATSELGEG